MHPGRGYVLRAAVLLSPRGLAAAVAQLRAVRLGHCHPSGWGHCWCPPRDAWGLPALLPVPCRLFACSQEEAEAGGFRGFFNLG